MLIIKDNVVEINGDIHNNFLLLHKITITVSTGIIPYIKTFHQSIDIPSLQTNIE